MAPTRPESLPDLGEALRPIVEALPEPIRPRFLAILERGAAGRYRTWADACGDTRQAAGLRACGERETEIGRLVDGLFPQQPDERERIAPALPKVAELSARLFEGRPLVDQLAIQAAGERRGAAVWRLLAAAETDPRRRDVLERCAALEEESAGFLEAMVRAATATTS